MKRVARNLAVITLLWVGPGVAADSDRQIIWGNAAHSRAYFIPETVLEEEPIDSLPLSESQRATLRGRLEWSNDPNREPRNPAGVVDECYPRAEPLTRASAPSPTTIDEALKKFPIVGLGVVESVVPGWVTVNPRVVRMVYVKIDTPLRQESAKIESGITVGVVITGGVLEIGGLRLCSDKTPGLFQPSPGDRVLIAGLTWPADHRMIDVVYVLPVRDGVVACEPLPALKADCATQEQTLATTLRTLPDGGGQ